MDNVLSPIKYSFVVPIYNDGILAPEFCKEFDRVFSTWLNIKSISNQVELIFVNDGSPDNSTEILKLLNKDFPFVKVIELSRNFGQHIALTCGYHHSKGEFVGMLNVDMEDPPSEIPNLLSFMIDGDFDIVYGLRAERESPFLDKLTSKLFQILLNKLTGNNFPLNTSTLRVMNRKFVDAYKSFSEKNRYLPGLEMWLGFKKGFTKTKHQARQSGASSYNFRRRLSMAFEAIVSFSDLPLRWSVLFGFILATIGFLLNIVLVIKRLFWTQMQPGYTSTVSIVVLFSGIQIILLGMLGIYVGRILKESQGRPLYVIRSKYNFIE